MDICVTQFPIGLYLAYLVNFLRLTLLKSTCCASYSVSFVNPGVLRLYFTDVIEITILFDVPSYSPIIYWGIKAFWKIVWHASYFTVNSWLLYQLIFVNREVFLEGKSQLQNYAIEQQINDFITFSDGMELMAWSHCPALASNFEPTQASQHLLLFAVSTHVWEMKNILYFRRQFFWNGNIFIVLWDTISLVTGHVQVWAAFLVFAARRILLPSGQLWFVPSWFQPCLTNLPTVKRPFHIGCFCSRVSVLNNICYRQGVICFHVNVL